jgi:hypothetical protein
MRDVDNPGDKPDSHEPPNGRNHGSETQDRHEPHPLFPRAQGGPERRDIRFVSFLRRRSDDKIDHCAEDFPAGEIRSWDQVLGPWGGGEYQALGKDTYHRVVARYPEKKDEWAVFDGASKPFTVRDPRYQPRPPSAAPAPAVAAAPSASLTSTPAETALLELLLELRAMPSAFTLSPDEAIAAMIQAHIEFLRTVLHVMRARPSAASLLSAVNPMILALQLLNALQGGVPDR